jgi:hypothetical protein
MLTFFRRIRKTLLGSGATGKYLLYAIGEILLVMIGILLALQVNNWNESRKDREREKKALIQLSKNLQMNCDQLERWIGYNNNTNKNGEVIIRHFENRLPYHDTLASYFWGALLQWNGELPMVGYEALKNVGLDILINDTLREEILNLFEIGYRSHHRSMKWGEEDRGLQEQLLDQTFLRQRNERGPRFIPFQPDEVFDNKYLYSVYVKRHRQRTFYNRYMDKALKETKRVLQLIKNELGETDKSQLN